ncbi:hypothetical protein IJG20_01760 [Candidatus Saccharibacteria bacterium]|nr:hypothetical protein [Candidatus Saccharibacteria bacterium]
MGKLVVKALVQGKDGKVRELDEYVRKSEQLGENGKEVLGGIDWEKTKEMNPEVTDEATLKELEKIKSKGAIKITNGDPEFFVAGAAKLKNEA